MSSLRWLSPLSPVDAFPSPDQALVEPNGLLAAGGDLSPERLLAAYSRGIFPWFEEGQPILWWSPDPRAVLWLDALHISRSLRRSIAKRGFTFRVDTAFKRVVAACAEPRRYGGGTWITAEMAEAYGQLHEQGFAHSFETWVGDTLVGGLYGVTVGRLFFGESMFTRATDASKVALAHAAQFLRSKGIDLVDCQVASAHTVTLGAIDMPRKQFLQQVTERCRPPLFPQFWR